MVAALSIIIQFDFRLEAKWDELLPLVEQSLQSDDQNVVRTGVLVFLEVARSFMWVGPDKRDAFNSALARIMPCLLSLTSNKLKHHLESSIEAVELLKTVFKAYCCSIRIELAPCLQQADSIVPWGSMFLEIIGKQLQPDALDMPEDATEREQHPWWKLKKWAYKAINILFERYAHSKRPEKRYAKFSKMFLSDFASNILAVCLRQIELLVHGSWMSSRTKQHLASFLESSVKRKVTWTQLKPHLQAIITHFIFPLLCFTEEDQELWEDNPVEFVHKKVDPPIDDFKCPSSAAAELLVCINEDRYKQAFQTTLVTINHLLSQYNEAPPNMKDPRKKYGILYMMSLLSKQALLKDSPMYGQVESFLMTYVVPDISSPCAFLRAKACDTFLRFTSDFELENQHNVVYSFQTVLNAMKDPELPVRVEAALALMPFFQYAEIKEALRPHSAEVLKVLLELTDQIDMDTLTHVMEQLVFEYSEELTPFAVQLTAQLRDTFFRVMKDATGNNDTDQELADYENKTFAAMGVLKTISSVLLAVEGCNPILNELDVIVVPIVDLILKNNILDLYEEGFEIIETLGFCSKSISPLLWSLFPGLAEAFQTDGIDYFSDMLPALQNYIIYGKDALAQSQEYRNMFFGMISFVMKPETELSESDRVRGCQLAEIMMLHMRGSIDEFIPKFVEMGLSELSNTRAKTKVLQIHAIEMVINTIFYNPMTALHELDRIGAVQPFFQAWFSRLDEFSRVHDKRLSILSLIGVLRDCSIEAYPVSVQNQYMHIFMAILSIFETYQAALDARAKEERIAKGEEAEEDNEQEVEEEYEEESDDNEDIDLDDEELDQLAQAAADAADANSDFDGQSDDDDWSTAGLMEEDVYFTTFLDEVDCYGEFKRLIGCLNEQNRWGVVESGLSAEKKAFVSHLLQMAERPREVLL